MSTMNTPNSDPISLKLSISNLKKLFRTSLSMNSEPYSNKVFAVLINHS
jgi:hypothetical protein